jgi:hypothetical protein
LSDAWALTDQLNAVFPIHHDDLYNTPRASPICKFTNHLPNFVSRLVGQRSNRRVVLLIKTVTDHLEIVSETPTNAQSIFLRAPP